MNISTKFLDVSFKVHHTGEHILDNLGSNCGNMGSFGILQDAIWLTTNRDSNIEYQLFRKGPLILPEDEQIYFVVTGCLA